MKHDKISTLIQQRSANISWNEHGQPVSSVFDDVYFSKENGLAESRYVFIEHNQLIERWSRTRPETVTAPPTIIDHTNTFYIGETGFGSGLNFLACWQAWHQHWATHDHPLNANYQHLHFISVEKFPLCREELTQALALWPELTTYAQALLAAYPPQPALGLHRLTLGGHSSKSVNGKDSLPAITLTLIFDDAAQALTDLRAQVPTQTPELESNPGTDKPPKPVLNSGFSTDDFTIDAWFLDGFAPAKNPGMWTPELFSAIASLSHTDTRFATFTAAGHVRRGLTEAGFQCTKTKGFGRKREMLIGVFHPLTHKAIDITSPTKDNITPNATSPTAANTPTTQHPQQQFWHVQQQRCDTPRTKTALVIGAGLAGCHSAFALAEKGYRVTVIEKNVHAALEASGNTQGVVYTRLSIFNDALSRFNLDAQMFADQFYQHIDAYQHFGARCGVLHQATSAKQEANYRQFAALFGDKKDPFAQYIETENTQALTGLALSRGGLFLPKSGWLDPQALCRSLLEHNNITLLCQQSVNTLKHNDAFHWQALDRDNRLIASADIAIICNAQMARQFWQTQDIGLKNIRGQVSHLPTLNITAPLRTVICGKGYISPAREQTVPTKTGSTPPDNHAQTPITSPSTTTYHGLGASFNLHQHDDAISLDDHRENLTKLVDMCPQLAPAMAAVDVQTLDGKVGFRCTTPDYFPVAGPVPNRKKMLDDFAILKKNARTQINQFGSYHSNLYCLLGLGSRGLAYAPLAASTIASLVSGDALPLSQKRYQQLHPARFLIRELMRS